MSKKCCNSSCGAQFVICPTPVTPICNPPVPFTTTIPGGLYAGKEFHISGVPSCSPSRFSIILMCGACNCADIALHFDVRFCYGPDRNVVVINDRQCGTFGKEERNQRCFPFCPNVAFEIVIRVEANCFKISVNNSHFSEFCHRVFPLQRADQLNITGDVRLTEICFQ
ncbi:galectin-5-like [Physella acuta]|uniref:galectin-5-like n=1 Tax=Physella acuta TaxID=109671 RepID=UPI0027DDF8B0|nr:galectin-5-like [Physella acuta]